MTEEKTFRGLFVGWDADSGEKVEIVLDQPVVKNPHLVVFGQPGSGKTVLCKALIEEAARNGTPCFVVDPQGDLSSLAIMGDVEKVKEKGTGEDVWTSYKNNVSVAVFTPSSRKGIPICVNPVKLPIKKEGTGGGAIGEEEVVQAIEGAATALCRFINFDPERDDGRLVFGFLSRLLKHYYDAGQALTDISTLAAIVDEPPGDASKLAEGYIKSPLRKKVAMLLRASLQGIRGLLLTQGMQLDIDKLVQTRNGKTPVNIFYLNTLPSLELKQFFVAVLVNQIYQWMLTQTSTGDAIPLRLILYIDEAAPFVPSGMSKPPAKRALQPLITQGRKYGTAIFFSTQTPGSMDGYMLGQANNILVGQLQTDLDLRRVDEIIEAMMKEQAETILQKIRLLPTGNFFLISPQQFPTTKLIRTRWLVTEHRIVPDEALKEISDKDALEIFQEEIKEKEIPAHIVFRDVEPAVIQEQEEELSLKEVYLKATNNVVSKDMLEASLANRSKIVLVPKKRDTLYVPLLSVRGKLKLKREFLIQALGKPSQIEIDVPINRFIPLSHSIPIRKYLHSFESSNVLLLLPELVFDAKDLMKAVSSIGIQQELSVPLAPLAVAIQTDLKKTVETTKESLQGTDPTLTRDQILGELDYSEGLEIISEVKRKLENEFRTTLEQLKLTQRDIQDSLRKLKERLLKIEQLFGKARAEQAKAVGLSAKEILKNIKELEELKKDAMDKTQSKLKESENIRTAIDRAGSEQLRIQSLTLQQTMNYLGLSEDPRILSKFDVEGVTVQDSLVLRTPIMVLEGEATHQENKETFIAVVPGRGRAEAHGVCLYQDHGEETRLITFCKTCLTPVCDMHTLTCATCGEPVCSDHATYCSTCGVVLCAEHVKNCAYEECNVPLCDSHVIQCESCRKYYCKKHITEARKGPPLLKTRKLLCIECVRQK
nr:DUF853 family protein [Candidatus Njordarchaeota archaeon]